MSSKWTPRFSSGEGAVLLSRIGYLLLAVPTRPRSVPEISALDEIVKLSVDVREREFVLVGRGDGVEVLLMDVVDFGLNVLDILVELEEVLLLLAQLRDEREIVVGEVVDFLPLRLFRGVAGLVLHNRLISLVFQFPSEFIDLLLLLLDQLVLFLDQVNKFGIHVLLAFVFLVQLSQQGIHALLSHALHFFEVAVFHQFRGIWPLVCIGVEHSPQEILCFLADALFELQLALDDVSFDVFSERKFFLREVTKRKLLVEHFIKHDSKTPDVHFLVVQVVSNHFGGNVVDGPAEGLANALEIGPAKISYFHLSILHEDVFGLQVSVNYSLFLPVKVGDCAQNLSHQLLALRFIQILLLHHRPQRIIAKLQNHVDEGLLVEDTVELDDVRVVALREDEDFVLKVVYQIFLLYLSHADPFEGIGLRRLVGLDFIDLGK